MAKLPNLGITSIISVLFTGYLNSGYSGTVHQAVIPKIWPNISDSGSFLQFPGLSGNGGLNFSFYDAFASGVNKVPALVTPHGNFTLLQAALLKTVGAIFAGVGVIIAEALILKKAHEEDLEEMHSHSQYGAPPPNSYGVPPTPSSYYGSPPPNSYGVPPPPSSSYGSPPPNSYGVPPPPSSSYGSPPPNSYGVPPPNSYDAPPPPSSSYSLPPPNSYGAPPPNSYDAPPPPSSSYGSPPPNSYGAPPPPSSSYGSPPPNSYGAPCFKC